MTTKAHHVKQVIQGVELDILCESLASQVTTYTMTDEERQQYNKEHPRMASIVPTKPTTPFETFRDIHKKNQDVSVEACCAQIKHRASKVLQAAKVKHSRSDVIDELNRIIALVHESARLLDIDIEAENAKK